METLEKLFDTKWGIITFYLIVAIISFIIARGISFNKVVSTNESAVVSYYA